MTDREYMTVAEVAELLRVSVTTIKRLAKAGEIPAVQLGVQWRFKREEILSLGRVRPAPPDAVNKPRRSEPF